MEPMPLAAVGAGLGVLLVLGALGLFITIFPLWRICSKAGYSGALSLLVLVPVFGWLLLFYLALAEWPVERRLRELELRSYNPNEKPALRPY
ncbi:MAG: hypothetical protein ACOY93_11705 [Bacillota bacterium]